MDAILYWYGPVRSKRPVGREEGMEKSRKSVQNRSKIRVVLRKNEPDIGSIRKSTVPFCMNGKGRSSSGPLSGTVGFLGVHTSAFHLLSWLLSPSILEKLSFHAGVFFIFRNKLSKFNFSAPKTLSFKIYYPCFFDFFFLKLSPFWRWSMNVVNCLEIFCIHFAFMAEL